jgi:hypothetical protein
VVLEGIRCCVQNTVPVIVTLHLVVEDLALSCGTGGDQVLVQNVQDVLADVFQLLLNLEK